MAPLNLPLTLSSFAKRQVCYYNECDGNYTSGWYIWGRWVVLGAVILVAFIIFLLISCVNARRRRKRGAMPVYGTGWMAGHGPVNYYPDNNNNNNNGQQQPYAYGNNNVAPQQEYQPPAYNPPTYTAPPPNQGYYAHQGQAGYELQPPSGTYQPQRGGEEVYAPPQGAPPKKR